MKKITEMIFHNFRSYEDVTVPFTDFTAIVGPSGSGKTNIVRGMRLCLYNYPSGDRYIMHGKDECFVEIRFNDGTAVRRSRGRNSKSGINLYELIHADGTITPLTNFGTGPIEPVIAFHKMPMVNLFGQDESLNICTQISSPFFLSESPQKKAKMIGRLAHTDVADLALQNLNGDVRRTKAEEKLLTKEKKEAEKEHDALSYVENAEGFAKYLGTVEQHCCEQIEKITRIENIAGSIERLEEKKNAALAIIGLESDVSETIIQMEQLQQLNQRLSRVLSLQRNLFSLQESEERTKSFLDNVPLTIVENTIQTIDQLLTEIGNITKIQKLKSGLDLLEKKKQDIEKIIEYETEVELLLNRLEDCKQKANILSQISLIQTKINTEQDRLKRGDDVIAQLQSKHDEKVAQYKDTLRENKICPVCQSIMSDQAINSIELD